MGDWCKFWRIFWMVRVSHLKRYVGNICWRAARGCRKCWMVMHIWWLQVVFLHVYIYVYIDVLKASPKFIPFCHFPRSLVQNNYTLTHTPANRTTFQHTTFYTYENSIVSVKRTSTMHTYLLRLASWGFPFFSLPPRRCRTGKPSNHNNKKKRSFLLSMRKSDVGLCSLIEFTFRCRDLRIAGIREGNIFPFFNFTSHL